MCLKTAKDLHSITKQSPQGIVSPDQCRLLLVPLTYRWIVQRCIEHNDGEAEHIAGVRVGKDIRIELAITLRKTLHHAIDLLRLTRQAK